MPPVLVFLHGWALDPALWDGLAARLGAYPGIVRDFGYFGEARMPSLPEGAPVVAVAHSFGALWLLHERPFAFDGLVAVNGFPRFTGPGGTPRRVVDRMLQRFDEDPETVLRNFRERCGLGGAMPGPARIGPLRAGLAGLRDWDESEALRASAFPVLALGGEADPIAPPSLLRACFSEPLLHPAGGHLLPLTEPDWCAERIRAFLGRWDGGS